MQIRVGLVTASDKREEKEVLGTKIKLPLAALSRDGKLGTISFLVHSDADLFDVSRGIHNISNAIRNIPTDLEGTPEISFSGISPKILTFEYYVKNIKLNWNVLNL